MKAFDLYGWASRASAVALCLGPPLIAQGHLYRVTDLGVVNYPSSIAEDINERGEVLVSANWPRRTYVYDPATGQLADIGTPAGELRFEGLRINERGQVVGKGIGADGLYLYTPGQGFRDLGRLLPTQPAAGLACGVNDLGDVVGSARGLAAGPEPFLWTAANGMQAVAPGVSGHLCDLNESGEAIGRIGNDWVYWLRSSGATGLSIPLPFEPETLQDDGTVTGYGGGQIHVRDRFGRITTLPGVPTQHTSGTVTGRNSAGVIAGHWQYYYVSGSSTHFWSGAFLHVPGRGTVDLRSPNNGLVDPLWEAKILTAMNELGQIVGFGGLRSTSATHAIRLDPVSPAAASSPVGQGCGIAGGGSPTLSSGLPVIARSLDFQLAGGAANRPGGLVLGFPAATPVPFGNCFVHLDLQAPMATFALATDAQGSWSGTIDLPPHRALLGLGLAAQAVVLPPLPALELTNAVRLSVGF